MFYIRDAVYAVWYLLGEFLVRHLWGDIQTNIEVLEAANRCCKEREHELVRGWEDAISQAQATYTKHLDENDKLWQASINELHAFYNAKLDAQKPKPKRKDPSKASKPIKPRAKKKVK